MYLYMYIKGLYTTAVMSNVGILYQLSPKNTIRLLASITFKIVNLPEYALGI